MLKAIHAQESKEAARKKAKDVVEQLRAMKLKEAAKKVEDGIEETLTHMDFPSQHWLKAHEPRDPETNPRCRHFSGRKVCSDAGLRQTAVCVGKGVGNKTVSLHEIHDRQQLRKRNCRR